MASEPQEGDKALAPAEVRRALETVLAGETLRGSPQLAAFLRFIVEAVLRGEGNRIKGYTIGVEALGRPANFDPQIDPIVRVEATRLRRALERYYAGPGGADPIVFELSRGSYIPAIVRRDDPAPTARPSAALAVWQQLLAGRRQVALVALVAVAIAIVIGIAAIVFPKSERPVVASPAARGSETFDGPLRAGNGMPTLEISRITILGPAPAAGAARPRVAFAVTLTEKLRTALARFDTLNIAAMPPAQGDGAGSEPAGSETVDYRLVGSGEFQQDGSALLRFRLVDVETATVVWSRSFEPLGPAPDYGPLEDHIVRQLATTLAQPFGVIRVHERARQLAGGRQDPRYRCILEASESFRSFDPAQNARAQSCLERLTARDPSFAMGFAYLAGILMRGYQYGTDAASADPAVLDRALRAARQAVELSPESARAYQMLFTVLFARQQTAAAFAAGDRALALNPYDMTILSDYGGRLILNGEIDRGMEALSRAAEEGAVRPSWYQFYLFLGTYLRNDLAAAATHASLIPRETYPFGLLAHTLIAATDGNRELARDTYAQLAARRPGWHKAAREELARLFPAPAVADRLARDLANAGVISAR